MMINRQIDAQHSDILIIGSGIAGLFAACTAADFGRSVQVLSYGAATLTMGGGTIDVLGYCLDGRSVKNPLAQVKDISPEHPYAKVQVASPGLINDALAKFLSLVKEEGYEYIGSPDKNMWLPTALGRFKPTCLVPRTMDASVLASSEHIIVADFDDMKDFHASLAVKNLQKRLVRKEIKAISIKTDFSYNQSLRDISVLDIARWLETDAGQDSFIRQMQKHIKPNTAVLLPPVFGLEPDYTVFDRLREKLGCALIELAVIPPAVTGLRLQKLLLRRAKRCGVKFVDKARVVSSEIKDGRCVSVAVKGFGRQKCYAADNFILATGGIYGGGLISSMGRLTEPIFNIDIPVPSCQTDWSIPQLFGGHSQPFAKFGVMTDSDLRPLNENQQCIADNVRVIGRSLSGYDFCTEQSGNGTALVTAYKAACDLAGRNDAW